MCSAGGVEAPGLWGRVAKYVLWTAEEKWKTKGWRLALGGKRNDELLFTGMMWANNYWFFSDDRETLT